MNQQMDRTEMLDDRIDEFCYELAVILRRILNLDEETLDDESLDD
jgi:hypothetical protein